LAWGCAFDFRAWATSGGTFSAYLLRLQSNGLLDEDGREVRAAGVLFGE
jgi:hypothetical protein